MSILDLLSPVVGPLIDKVVGMIPDPEERQKQKLALEAQLQSAALQAEQSQLDINKVEAASPSLFVAGWRPAVGWVCVVAFGWQYAVAPMLTYIIALIVLFAKPEMQLPPLPKLDVATLMPLLMALLGLGGMRTWEKTQGVARDNLTAPAPTPSAS
jgi:Holin of 3TMs, for gene-transfer release